MYHHVRASIPCRSAGHPRATYSAGGTSEQATRPMYVRGEQHVGSRGNGRKGGSVRFAGVMFWWGFRERWRSHGGGRTAARPAASAVGRLVACGGMPQSARRSTRGRRSAPLRLIARCASRPLARRPRPCRTRSHADGLASRPAMPSRSRGAVRRMLRPVGLSCFSRLGRYGGHSRARLLSTEQGRRRRRRRSTRRPTRHRWTR